MSKEAAFTRHPRPWSVNPEYAGWRETGNHAQAPDPILDANGKGIIGPSEWITMEVDVVEAIVAAVNTANTEKD